MQVSAYLNFNGNCAEAFHFYEQALGAKIECLMPHEGTPAAAQAPAEWLKKIIHGRLNVNGQIIMASDCPPNFYQQPQGFSVNLSVKEPAEADRVFQALSEGGQVRMPIQETFWAKRFGIVTDRFGTPWMVNCEKAVDFQSKDTEPAYAAAR